MIAEKVELLGKGLYGNEIPDVLTIKSIPTASELDYVGSEDFHATMLNKIFPKAIEEDINFHKLLEIDYQWLCRALRILNYGPYHTTNAIFCSDCGVTSRGEYIVDLRSIGCNVLPAGFKNDIVIRKDEFIEYDKDIHISLPTIQEALNSYEDKLFIGVDGRVNRSLARICYMMKKAGNETLSPVTAKLVVEKDMADCPADFMILKDVANQLTDYGLRAAGSVQCPACGSKEAVYVALVDDRFFRPSLGALRRWRDDRNLERKNGVKAGDKAEAVRKNN